ncbi:MAG: hypothetical protein ACRBCS_06535 [Cellvibrionaceae bacterium]
MDEKVIQHMAMLMSVNCVRKTVLDDYLMDGKLSEVEVATLMSEATDKLFTFLTYLLDKSELDKQTFLEIMNRSYPSEWPQPNLSRVFEEAVSLQKASQN